MYFPDIGSIPDCRKCDNEDCPNREKFQRWRRDFSVTSGRCPRLPDDRGFMDSGEEQEYARTFDLVHVELHDGKLAAHLSRTDGTKRTVYRSHGYWWFRDRIDGQPCRRVVQFAACSTGELKELLSHKHTVKMDFRARVEDYCI